METLTIQLKFTPEDKRNQATIDGAMKKFGNIAKVLEGAVDGREFVGLRDSDDRFAGVFELLIGRRWVWAAIEQVRTLLLKAPVAVLDLAFRPGELRLADGRAFAVTVPLVYPTSAAHGDDFALGQTVDWTERGGMTCGLGAKVLTAGEEDVALGECRLFEILSGR